MGQYLAVTAVLVLTGLTLLAILAKLRQFIIAIRQRGPSEPYVPVVDPNPPGEVLRTPGLDRLAGAAIGWAVVHVLVAGLCAASGWPLGRNLVVTALAGYLAVAAVLTGVGGGMLLAGRRYGRRAIALGQILLALAAIAGILCWPLMPNREEIPLAVRRAAPYITFGSALYLLLITALGVSAQHVGRKEEPGSTAEEPLVRWM